MQSSIKPIQFQSKSDKRLQSSINRVWHMTCDHPKFVY